MKWLKIYQNNHYILTEDNGEFLMKNKSVISPLLLYDHIYFPINMGILSITPSEYNQILSDPDTFYMSLFL